MTAQESESIARAEIERFNAHDLDGNAALFSADATLFDVAIGQTYRGPAGAREFAQNLFTALPDSACEITRVLAGDRSAAVEFWGRGTHTGPMVTPAGTIPPTGRKVEVRFCEMVDVENGKITRMNIYWDLNTMMTQLGLVPEAAHP